MNIRYVKKTDKEDIENIINSDPDGRDMLGSTGFYDYDTECEYWSPSFIIENDEPEIIGIIDMNILNRMKSMNIDLFYVQKLNRGKGIGKILLNHIIQEAKRFCCTTLTLKVYSYNSNAIKCYKKMGFKIIGKMKYQGWYKGKIYDILQMGMKI